MTIRPGQEQKKIRLRAVDAVKSGTRKSRSAEVFGISRRAISSWMQTNHRGGREALNAKKRGQPQEGGKLKPRQCATRANLIVHQHPDQLNLPFHLWTRQTVGQLIEWQFGNGYSVCQVGRYLRKWSCTVLKPGRKVFERCPEEAQNRLENEYTMVNKQAKTDKAGIQRCHETGMRSHKEVFRPALWREKGNLKRVAYSCPR